MDNIDKIKKKYKRDKLFDILFTEVYIVICCGICLTLTLKNYNRLCVLFFMISFIIYFLAEFGTYGFNLNNEYEKCMDIISSIEGKQNNCSDLVEEYNLTKCEIYYVRRALNVLKLKSIIGGELDD